MHDQGLLRRHSAGETIQLAPPAASWTTIQRREFIMTTLTDREEKTTTGTGVETGRTGHPDRGNRTLKAIVIALTVALVGLGAWVIVDRSSTPDTALSDDVAQVWGDYVDAWNDYDSDAFLALVTPDYTFVTGQSTTDAETQAQSIADMGRFDWHVTTVGEPTMAGNGPWYVSQVNRVEQSNWPEPVEGISVLTIVEVDGVLQVSNHTFFGGL
jgi:hypothetical protein